jgi:hypothetical protein
VLAFLLQLSPIFLLVLVSLLIQYSGNTGRSGPVYSLTPQFDLQVLKVTEAVENK